MKVGLAIGGDFHGRSKNIYDSLEEMGFHPEFILYCFPRYKTTSFFINFKSFTKTLIYELVYKAMPAEALRILFRKWLPDVDSKTYYAKGINSDRALNVFLKEKPDAVIVLGCGVVSKRLCDRFPNVMLNAHAGKIPEFRGMNNVEWAYLEDAPLIGTVHFMAPGVDAGDIVYERELQKEREPKSINEIRQKAFDQVFALFPRALKVVHESGFKPIKQTEARTTRYVMHSFLRHVLEKKLGIDN